MYEYIKPQSIKKMNDSEREVFMYVCNHKDEVINMKIQDLADRTYVSKTTVVRMSKKLGFEGFTEFRYFLRKVVLEKRNRKQSFDHSILGKRQCDIGSTLNLIHEDELQKIAQKIIGNELYIYAEGKFNFIKEYLKNQLDHLKINVLEVDINECNFNGMNLVLLIDLDMSRSKLIELAQDIKETGATLISLTSIRNKSISEFADYPLFVMSDKDVPINNNSPVPLFIMIQSLIDVIIEQLI